VIDNRRATRGVIAVRARTVVLGLLAVGLIFALTACMGGWFTHEQNATLIIGKPVITGNHGEVLISVTSMPSQGLASIAIDDQGITTANIDPTSVQVEGLNGFTVLASEFVGTSGRLDAANSTSGSVGGTIIKITFEVTGANPTFAVDKAKVSIGSALNTLITAWDLNIDTTYYAK